MKEHDWIDGMSNRERAELASVAGADADVLSILAWLGFSEHDLAVEMLKEDVDDAVDVLAVSAEACADCVRSSGVVGEAEMVYYVLDPGLGSLLRICARSALADREK